MEQLHGDSVKMYDFSFLNVRQMNQELVQKTMDRRRMLKLFGSAGLAVAGVAAVAGTTRAASGVSAAELAARYHQEDQAALAPGPREDGTNLWKVLVGGMDMETAIE